MNPKLIICIDGLGYDLVTRQNTPFLYACKENNSLSRLQTLFAFTGIEYTFFTGKTPKQNGIWLEFIKSSSSIFKSKLLSFFLFNKTLRTYIGVALQYSKGRTWISGLHNIPQKKIKYFDSSVKQAVYKLDFFKDEDFSVYKWPFFVTKEYGKEKKKIIFKYEDDEQRLNRLLSSKGKELYYTQLMSIDKTIHKFGKKSMKTKEALRNIDEILEKYINRFLNENKNADIFVWSDHGFVDIREYIGIEKELPKRRDYLYFIAGTTASFWFENEESKKQVLKSLANIKDGRILDEQIAEKYKIPLLKEYGEIVFFIEKGKYFFPNFYQKNSSEKFAAMHGYPEDKELDGIFMTNIKKKKDLKMHEIIEVISE